MCEITSIEENKLSTVLTSNDHQVIIDDNPLITSPCLYLICGGIGCGKTNLLLNLLTKPDSPYYGKNKFDFIFMISPTAKGDPKLNDLIDELENDNQYYTEINSSSLNDIKNKILKIQAEWIELKRKKNDLNIALIIDDCADKLKSKDVELLRDLCIKARHYRLFIFITSQQYVLIPTLIRRNALMISIFKTENQKEIEALKDELSADKNKFIYAFQLATSIPFSFLHINLLGGCKFYIKFDKINFAE